MNEKFKVKFSWALYDWANSAWSAIIITFIFSRYFVDVLSPNPDQGTLFWTWTIGLSSLLAAIISPVVGGISDQTNKSKLWLVFTTSIYALIAISLWFAEPNLINLFIIIILIFIGNLAYEISQIFYNGQLRLITNEKNFAKLSGLAWGLGYAGTVVIFIIYYGLFFLPSEPIINLDINRYENIRISFLITGIWIILFSLPLFIILKESRLGELNTKNSVIESFKQVKITFKEIKKYKNLVWFLIARLFYMDGINAIFAVAAIYATIVFGMSTTDIIMLGIGTNIAAGIGSCIFSFIENKLGSKNTIILSLICIFIISFIILFVDQKNLFIILAIILSTFFGPVQSASRVYFAKSIPENKKFEFFGFYSFSGKVTSFIGPVLYGTVAFIFSSPQLGLASLLLLFAIGLILMIKVDNDKK